MHVGEECVLTERRSCIIIIIILSIPIPKNSVFVILFKPVSMALEIATSGPRTWLTSYKGSYTSLKRSETFLECSYSAFNYKLILQTICDYAQHFPNRCLSHPIRNLYVGIFRVISLE